MNADLDFESLTAPPDHERRARGFISAIDDLQNSMPSCDLQAFDDTAAVDSANPKLIEYLKGRKIKLNKRLAQLLEKNTIATDSESSIAELRQEMDAYDRKSAYETKVIVSIRSNSGPQIREAETRVMDLAEQFGAQKIVGGSEYMVEELSNLFVQIFDPDGSVGMIEIHYLFQDPTDSEGTPPPASPDLSA